MINIKRDEKDTYCATYNVAIEVTWRRTLITIPIAPWNKFSPRKKETGARTAACLKPMNLDE